MLCFQEEDRCFFGRGIYCDLKRRLPHYLSDYKDGKHHLPISTTYRIT